MTKCSNCNKPLKSVERFLPAQPQNARDAQSASLCAPCAEHFYSGAAAAPGHGSATMYADLDRAPVYSAATLYATCNSQPSAPCFPPLPGSQQSAPPLYSYKHVTPPELLFQPREPVSYDNYVPPDAPANAESRPSRQPHNILLKTFAFNRLIDETNPLGISALKHHFLAGCRANMFIMLVGLAGTIALLIYSHAETPLKRKTLRRL